MSEANTRLGDVFLVYLRPPFFTRSPLLLNQYRQGVDYFLPVLEVRGQGVGVRGRGVQLGGHMYVRRERERERE
jgi:hypothetical protein